MDYRYVFVRTVMCLQVLWVHPTLNLDQLYGRHDNLLQLVTCGRPCLGVPGGRVPSEALPMTTLPTDWMLPEHSHLSQALSRSLS